ncbi:hypothetical protein [Desulfobacula phenolica]|uniref:Lipoprotein n=1 Tax=Desulfobacula phenolica TaxID=90732 RepID=A0A1H2KHX0_9BACT|nr:hypothetical protein [Desulfobacula phenolica]SDU67991.1 hypothetical protein SAMN04487931_1501 [Desulfobacula phenolica]
MILTKTYSYKLFVFFLSLFVFSSCVAQNQIKPEPQVQIKEVEKIVRIPDKAYTAKTVEAYERAGNDWGARLRSQNFKPKQIDNDFVEFLISGKRPDSDPKGDWRTSNYYFTVHLSLKKAFQEGFRKGFQDREADLVLGPHIEVAAGRIGKRNSEFFADDVSKYVQDQINYQYRFKKALDNSVAIFKELIAEGSPADRDKFKESFLSYYTAEVEEYLKRSNFYTSDKTSYINLDFNKGQIGEYEGKLYISKFGILTALEMWDLLYKKSLYMVGLEMGQTLSHNLITRSELLEWLRRTRTALRNNNIEQEIAIIRKGFVEEYGRNGKSVFNSMVREISR